ncbi:Bug family tripartite tricarboxylate transporter substrate binding protein [Bordetella bronchiseptica]|uniref:Bug family tripartite tricarboxylate transporter substrate binding protein n=1 Tax=Bordetella bronchiseptica TaxID=518 RepID=UPI00049FA1E2|nr:tripartite tricarboxylate transporter substrate binding protein [Bordetella bronchiseptica]KDC86705.1 tripartite tricarboxylate transporter family receptor [Bordetella bronchiseptica MBORD665]KDC87928.1 tripartite tricarboxylate transporter family receptor [Bordetella bronchiseptica MBORD668]
MMKGICAAFAFAALAASWQGPAQAAFPDQPIKLVVPFAPGATIGPLAQLVSEQLSSDLGTPVYTEFKTGAGGNIGADIVAKSPGDGYTLLLGTISILTINPSLYPDLPFDPVKDFKPVSMLVTTQNILVVNPESKIQSVADLADYARQHPGQATFGSSGTGSTMHLAGELFSTTAQVKMTHVPYRGGGPARSDLLGGRLTLMFSDLSAVPMVQAGKLRALAVTGSQRDGRIPDIPTMQESGMKGFDVEPWYGLVAPASTPDAVIARLNASVRKVFDKQQVRDALQNIGLRPASDLSVAYMAGKIDSDLGKWAPIVKSVDMKTN